MDRTKLIHDADLTEVINQGTITLIGLRKGELVVGHGLIDVTFGLRRSVEHTGTTDTGEVHRIAIFAIFRLLDVIIFILVSAKELEVPNASALGEGEFQLHKLHLHACEGEGDITIRTGKNFFIKHGPAFLVAAAGECGPPFNAIVGKSRTVDHRGLAEIDHRVAVASGDIHMVCGIVRKKRIGTAEARRTRDGGV